MRYISSRRQHLSVHSSTRRSAGRAAVDPRRQQASAAGSPPPSSRSASGDREASARTAGPAGAFEPQAASPARQKLFNRIAPVYDELNNKLSFGQHWIWKRMTVKWSAAKRKDRVLDVCCGSGDLALLLAEVVGPDGQVVGLDYAPEMLDDAALRAEERVRRSARPGVPIRWVQGDALDLPFPDAHFDALTMGYGLRNVVDRPRALRELHRVLKPGAKAAVLDFNNSTNPVVDQIQAAFLEQLVVPEARKYGLEDEYEYLRPSIKAFATGPEQEQMALAAGFSKAAHFEISFGLMGVLVATKAA